MDTIYFKADVGEDRIIRVPEGVSLPTGPADIAVTPKTQAERATADIAATRAWLLKMAGEAEADATPLPTDLAENHDFYAHGKPRE